MNNYNPNDFKFQRTDPFKHGYWEEENKTNWTEVIISTISIIAAFAAIIVVLFLN